MQDILEAMHRECAAWAETSEFDAAFRKNSPVSFRTIETCVAVFLVLFLFPIGVGFLLVKWKEKSRQRILMRESIIEHPPVLAYTIILNHNLGTKPGCVAPGMLLTHTDGKLHAFDPAMAQLADTIAEWYEGNTETDAQRDFARQMQLSDDTYKEGRRRPVPVELAKGQSLHLLDTMIVGDWMPDVDLQLDASQKCGTLSFFFPCFVMPGEWGYVMMVPDSIASSYMPDIIAAIPSREPAMV